MPWESYFECNQVSLGMLLCIAKAFQMTSIFAYFSIVGCFWIAENCVIQPQFLACSKVRSHI